MSRSLWERGLFKVEGSNKVVIDTNLRTRNTEYAGKHEKTLYGLCVSAVSRTVTKLKYRHLNSFI